MRLAGLSGISGVVGEAQLEHKRRRCLCNAFIFASSSHPDSPSETYAA
jgi:hypothetical protein